MATLESGFEDKLRGALVEDIQQKVIDGRDNLAFALVQAVHDRFRDYGSRHDYDVEPIIDSLGQPEVDRRRDGVTVRLEWGHVAAKFMALGSSSHTIRGDPILSFVWERRHDPPQWVREQYEPEGDGWRVFLSEVEVEGLPEGRMYRDALAEIRRQVERG